MYLRTNAPRPVVRRGPKPSVVGIMSEVQATIAPATNQAVDLGLDLQSQLGIAASSMKGYRLKRIVGDVVAVPLNAPAAGAKSILYCALVKAQEALSPNAFDPAIATSARNQLPYVWTGAWFQPYVAAPVAASQLIEARRLVNVRRRRGRTVRSFTEVGETMFFIMSTLGTEQWSVQAWFRLFYQQQ